MAGRMGVQVVEGYEFINCLTQVGRPDQDGTTHQRVTLEGCGVLPATGAATATDSLPSFPSDLVSEQLT